MGREQRRREAEAHERVRDDEPEEMAQAVPPNSTRGAMRGHGRGRSRAHRSRLTASCAGLRPEAVYAYSERSHGRASRPRCTGRTVAPTVDAHWKAKPHTRTARHARHTRNARHGTRRGGSRGRRWSRSGRVGNSSCAARGPAPAPPRCDSRRGARARRRGCAARMRRAARRASATCFR